MRRPVFFEIMGTLLSALIAFGVMGFAAGVTFIAWSLLQ